LTRSILAIDIGSINTTAVIAEVDNHFIKILGSSSVKSQGIKKGTITNIEEISKAINQVVSEARRIAGNNINHAVVSISNAYATSLNSTGVVNIPHKDISINELNRAMQAALYNANVPNDYEVIHVLPYNFRVDGQEFIEDPYGMNASRLEVDVNVIITQKTNLSNLKKAVQSAGIEIDNIVLNGYASSIATMTKEEKDGGAIVLDLGGQTSTVVIHLGNSIRFNDFLAVGSNHITNDLSAALHTPTKIAEEVKIHYANLAEKSDETIELPIMGNEDQKNIASLEFVYSVVFARVEETLTLLAKTIEESGLKNKISGGIILTGGMSKLPGIRDLAQSIFPSTSTSIGKLPKLGGFFEEINDPQFATVVGLIMYKAGYHTEYEIDNNKLLLHKKETYNPIKKLDDIKMDGEQTEEKPLTEKRTTDEKKEDIFSFNDFPDLDKEHKKGTLQKVTTWAKQLF
jgi:cell division protein FtsA